MIEEVQQVQLTLRRRSGHVQEHQAAEQGAQDERGPRYTLTIDALEDGRSLAFGCERVECARSDVQVGAASAQHKDENAGVDDVVEDPDPDERNSWHGAI